MHYRKANPKTLAMELVSNITQGSNCTIVPLSDIHSVFASNDVRYNSETKLSSHNNRNGNLSNEVVEVTNYFHSGFKIAALNCDKYMPIFPKIQRIVTEVLQSREKLVVKHYRLQERLKDELGISVEFGESTFKGYVKKYRDICDNKGDALCWRKYNQYIKKNAL